MPGINVLLTEYHLCCTWEPAMQEKSIANLATGFPDVKCYYRYKLSVSAGISILVNVK
jgi:hypothetical protein